MKNYHAGIYFVAALKAQLADKERGFQTQLAKLAGVSRNLLNDIIKGRSFGADDKRRALASALGYADFEIFLDIGRKLMGVPPVRKKAKILPPEMPPDLVELLQENRSLRKELDAVRQELELLRLELTEHKAANDPTAFGQRTAQSLATRG